jgi:hypothetical protein
MYESSEEYKIGYISLAVNRTAGWSVTSYFRSPNLVPLLYYCCTAYMSPVMPEGLKISHNGRYPMTRKRMPHFKYVQFLVNR